MGLIEGRGQAGIERSNHVKALFYLGGDEGHDSAASRSVGLHVFLATPVAPEYRQPGLEKTPWETAKGEAVLLRSAAIFVGPFTAQQPAVEERAVR